MASAALRLAASAALLAALLAVAPGAGAQDDPAPAGGEADPGAPASEAAAPKAGGADLEALKKELEDAYLAVERDFRSLTGPEAGGRAAALARAVAAIPRSAGRKTAAAKEVAEAWVREKLLGPIVAGRLADAAAPLLDAGEEAAAAIRRAVRVVFPESTMEDNWDLHFLDLEVVRRWKAANAGTGAPAEGGPEAAAPSVPDPADMVLVPRGDLNVPANRGRGWPNFDQKADRKTLKAFYIDRVEVSRAAFAAFLRELKDRRLRERYLPAGWELDEGGMPVPPAGRPELPVVGITYEGALAFAEHLGKRLPTEDEWERAARGNEGFLFPWGNEWKAGAAVAGGKTPGPAPVGATAGDRSPFGAMDMAGNVSELCATYVDGKPVRSLPKDTDQIVRRGGNFHEDTADAANDWRYVTGPSARSELVGFRCAMDERDYDRRYGKK